MNFQKKDTVQDVIVACCILYNMLKISKQNPQEYRPAELRHQFLFGQSVLDAEEEEEEGADRFRIQNHILHNYFNPRFFY